MGGFGLSKKRVRRFWSDDEKWTICAQTRVAGVSVASVARRYGVNANLVFRWLKEPGFQVEAASSDDTVFLPVEIPNDADPVLPATPLSAPMRGPGCASVGRIEIALCGGHRLTVEGGFDGDALARLLKGLMS